MSRLNGPLRASVIVPARDAEGTLPALLDGLSAQALEGGHEVIVVDNGSHDRTVELARRSEIVTTVVERPRGDGPGVARNAGTAVATGAVLAFIDADCRPAPGWLAAGVLAADRFDLVQGRVLPDPDVPLGPFDRTLSVERAHGLFESANLFVRREVFNTAGGFPEGLETALGLRDAEPFGEDVVFGWRLRRSGATSGFCAQAVVFHAVVHRGPAGFASERTRQRLFPLLAASVPELRDEFFYRRYFLSRRTAAFDLALGAVMASGLTHRRWPLIGIAPYLRMLSSARRWGVAGAPLVAGTEAIADAVGAVALARGSARYRSPVL